MDGRQSAILTCLVDGFIEYCQPISSKMVQDRLPTRLSAASVRQVFSVLDANGYVEKRHLSSGRVPTSKGYRAYVDQLMYPKAIQLRSKFHPRTYRIKLENWVINLSKKWPYIGILAFNRDAMGDIAMAEYVSLGSHHGCIMVFYCIGVVSTVHVVFDRDVSDLDTHRLMQWLIAHDMRVQNRSKMGGFTDQEWAFIQCVHHALVNHRKHGISTDNMIIKNIQQCFCLADYTTKDAINQIVAVLDDQLALNRLLNDAVSHPCQTIAIGDELSDDRLGESTLMRFPVMVNDYPIATLGILGPRRMNYMGVMNELWSYQTLVGFDQF
jgi:heat-inducible transcriptional repressor